jgi:hypothetical protein
MNYDNNQDPEQQLKVKGGNPEEQAAALAVIRALLSESHSSPGKEASDWNGKGSLREGLGRTWKGQITI